MAKHEPRTYDSISSPSDNLITYSDRLESFRILSTYPGDLRSVETLIAEADKIARYLADGTMSETEPVVDE